MLHFRFAELSDAALYFEWANDPLVRANSYRQQKINYDDHVRWFRNRLEAGNTFFYLFFNEPGEKVGQVRIDKDKEENIIGISIDKRFRGLSLGATMLQMACTDFISRFPGEKLTAYIKEENVPSYKTFIKAGFGGDEKVLMHQISSYRLKYPS